MFKLNIFFIMKILDCTLRDGGYYTDWYFSEELLNQLGVLERIVTNGSNNTW